MGIMIKKLYRVLTAISKKKWVYFGILTLGLLASGVQAARYSDLKIWANMPKYFIKPENADMLIYNLSVGYIVSYMFYIFVNFIPDLLEAIEKQNTLIPFRATMQREIQEFERRIIDLWISIGINASIKEVISISEINKIEEFFELNSIKQISKCVKLMDQVDQSIEIDIANPNKLWVTKIKQQLEGICTLGNMILTRYKNDIPPGIFYDIFYLLNQSGMIGELLNVLNAIMLLRNGRNFKLIDCIYFDDEKMKEDINKSCKAIINLYIWVNSEYTYLASNTNDKYITISNIKFSIDLK
ncbi:hypothetical protein [Clostridium beijerinckii]|uniref:hypothetical protein n=1 Tax=Clostridium beijerinckii TaxID=1520 RepID=UPI000AFF5293|nr:hypothetical protein [Clostridium beijerinckii]